MKTGSGKKKMRLGLGLIALGISLIILGSQASRHVPELSGQPASESVSYRMIDRQNLGADVTSFFWYGCPHCLRLEHTLHDQSFRNKISALSVAGEPRASYQRIPAALNEEWALDARLFYVLDGHGMTDDGHIEMMSIIQGERPRTRQQMLALLKSRIVPLITAKQLLTDSLSPELLDTEMFSRETDVKVQSSIDMGRSIGLDGVPVMVVDGNKVISLGRDATYETMGPTVISILESQSQ